MGEIVTRNELPGLVNKIRQQGKTIVTTNGAFDILHVGHLKSLKFAKEHGDVLIVGLNSDSSIKQYKSENRPILPENQRAEMLKSVTYVDYVTVFEVKTPCDLLEIIRPDIHVKGSEYQENIPEKDVVEKHGGKVLFIQRDKKDVSTTQILNKVKNNDYR